MTKISELTSIVTAAATDIIAVVQGGVTKRATVQDYRDAGIIPTADQAAALAAYEAALAAAEAGQVHTASGPGEAAFAAAAEDAWLTAAKTAGEAATEDNLASFSPTGIPEDSGVAKTAVGNATKLQSRTLVNTAPSDGQAIVWDAGNSQWEPGDVAGGASDVGDLTTTGLTSTNMLRVAAAGGLEERTPAQVLSDIGALNKSGDTATNLIDIAATVTATITGTYTVNANVGRLFNLSIDGDAIIDAENGAAGVSLVIAIANETFADKTIVWGTSIDVGSGSGGATIPLGTVSYFTLTYFSVTGKWHLSVGSTGYAAAAAQNWWEASGATGAIAVYQPKGASSLAASYLDLSGNGNHASPTVAPTWDATNGWIFGGTNYLATGIYPSPSYTVLIRFSAVANANPIAGSWQSDYRFDIYPNFASGVIYGNCTALNRIIVMPGATSGVLGIAGPTAYRNGSADGTITLGTVSPATCPIEIGRQNAATPSAAIIANIQAFALYDNTLIAEKVAAVSAAMAAL